MNWKIGGTVVSNREDSWISAEENNVLFKIVNVKDSDRGCELLCEARTGKQRLKRVTERIKNDPVNSWKMIKYADACELTITGEDGVRRVANDFSPELLLNSVFVADIVQNGKYFNLKNQRSPERSPEASQTGGTF